MPDPRDINRAIEAVWRIESTRLTAGLARFTGGDLGQAEDLAQESLVAALEDWPGTGIPDNPGAWLMATAKNRAIDRIHRAKNLDRKYQEIGRDTDQRRTSVEDEVVEASTDLVGDDVLSLIFTTCHPLLSPEARVALTLRLLGGLSTGEIARAYLVPVATVGQRISRAKRTLAEAKIPFGVPSEPELEERLSSVLEVIYLIFNEGHSATAGADWMKPELMNEAMRLGRILARLLPDEPEVHGLLSLIEIQASRLAARTAADGSPVLLLEQDRGKWDRLLINRGLEGLKRAEELPAPLGYYTLQAAIAACHARARTAGETDWERIAALYDALAQLTGSPVVELNRAVAVSMAYGPEEALELVDDLVRSEQLDGYHLLPGVRGDLLQKLGRYEEARTQFEVAAALTKNEAERGIMLARAGECGS
jgi:RNA polymerase sigma factor (sigma-70 family)